MDQPATTSSRATLNRVFLPVAGFLTVFGVFNFAELPLRWKDRTEQITRYLQATVGLGSDWVTTVLWITKLAELALGVVAGVALVRRSTPWLVVAVAGWMAVFTMFAALDVWAADRAELQEHTVYFGVFAVLLVAVHVVAAVDRISAATAATAASTTVDDRSRVLTPA